ncbi:hypothetical protein [Mucilaginibacter ginsenosidivorans]|uniref:Uncharacterized protein n=1 Tax=Mucilaginibacter ginsenosidivorans TaxID=398053 RepID=A0A5B8UVU5_9SPHI|nr:hypothetical protein [Mucilaginibacter ginsenosidivorans]QEC63073.1 hypothetical protein FRZ54_10950 [Mucilaginibacter ginsenosidivorans]
MPEVIIKYKKPETLKILKGLAKYFDFKVSSPKDKQKKSLDDIIIPGDKTLDISSLNQVFTGKNLDAKELRKEMWKR